MIYPSDFEEKVGFKAVRELLSDKCISPLGVAKCYSMNFSADFNRVRKYLLQTAEMLSLVKSGVDMPIDNIYDVTPYLKEIKAEGSFISSKNLYKVKLNFHIYKKRYCPNLIHLLKSEPFSFRYNS